MPSSSLKVRLFTIKTAQLLMTILFLFLIYVLSRQAAALVLASSVSAQTAPPTVVIDSGHGGNDPGKIGVDGSLEKDLNLTIARKLKYYLETSGVQVIMTRDSDTGLYKETDSHKKTADLKARCQLINDTTRTVITRKRSTAGRCSIIKLQKKENAWQTFSRNDLISFLEKIIAARRSPMIPIIFYFMSKAPSSSWNVVS